MTDHKFESADDCLNYLNSQAASDDFNREVDEWEKLVHPVLNRQIQLSEWPEHLEANIGDLAILIEEFDNILKDVPHDYPGPFVRFRGFSKELFHRVEKIVRVITVYCDRKTHIDPTSFVEFLAERERLGEKTLNQGEAISMWSSDREEAATLMVIAAKCRLTIRRLNLWVESSPSIVRAKETLDQKVWNFILADKERALSMSSQELAKAVGQKSKTGVLQTPGWAFLKRQRAENRHNLIARLSPDSQPQSGQE